MLMIWYRLLLLLPRHVVYRLVVYIMQKAVVGANSRCLLVPVGMHRH